MPALRRANHNLSHYRLATFDMGLLVPVACVEVLMGDTFIHTASALLRASTLVTPVMHPVDIRIHHWYVPNRIIFDGWDDLITGKEPDAVVPTNGGGWIVSEGDVLDHMGIPPGNYSAGAFSLLPLFAYNRIYNEFYRDQDLIAERLETNSPLARIGWSKDYFTTSRPTPQQGAAISIPFEAGTLAPVQGIYARRAGGPPVNSLADEWEGVGATVPPGVPIVDDGDGTPGEIGVRMQSTAAIGAANRPQVFADLSAAQGGGIDVNEFRMAMAMQRHLEARNRWGSRIQDYLAYHGLRSLDARLDLPEYLGGGKSTIAFSEVLATAEGTSTNVGDQAGHGIASLRTRRYGHLFPESGWMLSLMSVRPRTIYADQMHRQFIRTGKDDYWQREYEAFGPQAVLTKEVFATHTPFTDVFGYQGRHDEYRRFPSYVSGGFRSLDDSWHMARFFETAPALNQQFVECLPTDRIYADTSEPECRAMISHSIRAKRLVGKRSRY